VSEEPQAGGIDVGEYCRRVEDHLTRVNGGHLVRIVGPGFELVRRWAQEGIPLSFVMRGIDAKATRHHRGRQKRPLRIEFCEADVRGIYDGWRRAVGLAGAEAATGEGEASAADRRRPSLSRHLDRAVESLGHVAGRLELAEPLREALTGVLGELTALRERARHLRGPGRNELVERLAHLDRDLLTHARTWTDRATLDALEQEAEVNLIPYRDRLSADIWQRSVAVTVDRLLRDHLGLPTLDLER
jgi:hypothetical protein